MANPFIAVITLNALASNNYLPTLLTTAGYTGMPAFSQLTISAVGGSFSISNSSAISDEATGFPVSDSFTIYANRAGDTGSVIGMYLYSATASQKVAVYARPLS